MGTVFNTQVECSSTNSFHNKRDVQFTTRVMLSFILVFLILSNAIGSHRDQSILFGRFTMQSLLFVIYFIWSTLNINALENGIGIYGGLFFVTSFSHGLSIFFLVITTIILILSSFFPRSLHSKYLTNVFWVLGSSRNSLDEDKTSQQFRIIEYPLIIVFAIFGGLFLISCNDLISIFLSIELQSYALYILSTLYRDSESATSSALTYFLLGGLSSCFILLGSSLLYVNSGTTNLENIYIICSLVSINDFSTMITWYQPNYIHLSLIIVSVGFLFKVTAAPFHFWSPDVYDGIPTIVTTFVAIVAKISIFGFLLELVYYTEQNVSGFSWKGILLISSFFSLIVGSVMGLTQTRIKKLYAYSTINHVGFILFALAITTAESIQSYIFYILQYSIANLNAFIILIAIGTSIYYYNDLGKNQQKQEEVFLAENPNLIPNYAISTDEYFSMSQGSNSGMDKKINEIKRMEKQKRLNEEYSPLHLIAQVKGYFTHNSYISISFAITIFSFVGLPPIIGFFAKQMILSSALDSGYIFMSLIAIITSVIGATYYLNLIKEIFFFKPEYSHVHSMNDEDQRPPRPDNKDNKRTLYTYTDILSDTLIEKSPMPKTKLDMKNIKAEIEGNITLNGSITIIISLFTLFLIFFIFFPEESINIASLLSLILFKS